MTIRFWCDQKSSVVTLFPPCVTEQEPLIHETDEDSNFINITQYERKVINLKTLCQTSFILVIRFYISTIIRTKCNVFGKKIRVFINGKSQEIRNSRVLCWFTNKNWAINELDPNSMSFCSLLRFTFSPIPRKEFPKLRDYQFLVILYFNRIFIIVIIDYL